MTELFSKLFVKDHKSLQNPRVRAAYGTMVSVVGIILNLCLFSAKFLVGTLFGAVSIVADAVNNLSDAGTQILSLISFRISAKPADREHPFGHARMEYVTSMIVSFLVLLIGFELFKESVDKILHPVLPDPSPIAAAVLVASVLAKLWLAYFNHKIGKKLDSPVMRATTTDSLSDALSTTAVLAAVLVRIFFPSSTLNLDAYIGALVAVMILIAGIKILNETKNSILGEAPSQETVELIRATVEKYPGALGIHDLVVHNYGSGHTIAALHVEVDGKENIFATHDMIDNMEQELRRDHGIEATIHMDPVVTDDQRVTDLKNKVTEAVTEIDERIRIHDFRFVEGVTHSNLIFDVAVPFEVKLTDDEVKCAVADQISRLDPTYFTVVTVDRE